MDITQFIVSLREKALLDGDYGTYRAQLGRKLLNCRKRLDVVVKNRGKFQRKGEITAEQMTENHDYLRLQLLTAERAWAHAMAMKSAHATDTKGLSAHTRSHIVSRLDKSARIAESVANSLSHATSSVPSSTDILEARAYASLLRGAAQFEKHSWEPCLESFSTARIIYNAIGTSAKGDVYTEVVTETIDPSMRFAAYRLKIPRTQPIPAIARRAFPTTDTALVDAVRKINLSVLEESGQGTTGHGASGAESTPQVLTWRSREVRIEDAAIATAWSSVQAAKSRLREKLSSTDMPPKDMAAAYDELLTASQDAVDATRQAIDDMRREGVGQGDQRMQSLQITRTAVNYEAISWRIGRNRVLIGQQDGATAQPAASRPKKAAKGGPTPEEEDEADEPLGRRLTGAKEKVVLYDGVLQSIESIRELPGVAADERLTRQLAATYEYFNALKCLALARSHSWVGQRANALALVHHALAQCDAARPVLSSLADDTSTSPANIAVSKAQVEFLHGLLKGEEQRFRALVEIGNLQSQAKKSSGVQSQPLVARLLEYPSEGVDLESIVVYPPRLEPMAVKPLFLDVAWNYIGYSTSQPDGKSKQRPAEKAAGASEEKQPQKKGWFGFGR